MKKSVISIACVLLFKDSYGFSNPSSRSSVFRTSPSSTRTELTASTKSVEIKKPVQRVAIIGAGIAGLSLAHALLTLQTDATNKNNILVDIFDSRPELDENAGSGIQLTGGLVALNEISTDLYRKVADAALPLERLTSRCRPWFGTKPDGDNVEQGWKLLEMDIQKAIRDDATAKRQIDAERGSNSYKLVTDDGEVVAYTILRGTLQRILHEELMQEHGIQVQFSKKLGGLSYSSGDSEVDGIMCQFNNEDNFSGPYDLVVGCDGIQSVVKQYIDAGKIDPVANEQSKKSKSSAIYSGIRITFAIQDGDANETPNSGAQFTQFFGNGAYALTSSYGTGKGKPPAKGAFLIYSDENYIGPFRKNSNDKSESTAAGESASENPDWTQDNRIPREHISECLAVLQSASVPGNAVANIVQSSNRFFDLGVYFHNPLSWNGWVREFTNESEKTGKFAVLAGDAAHAMPPFLGQGANQALQDSYALASKIHQYNKQVLKKADNASDEDILPNPSLNKLLKDYEHMRWLPTASITAKAAFLGYLETGSDLITYLRDAFFFVMGKIGVAKKVFLDSANPKIK